MMEFPKVKATIEGQKNHHPTGGHMFFVYNLLLDDIYLPIENRIFWTGKFPK